MDPEQELGHEVPRPRRRARTIRISLLVVGLVAASGVLGWRLYQRAQEPSAGDRYAVTFTVNRQCGTASMEFDGLTGSAEDSVFRRWPTETGTGTVTITEAHDLTGMDGIGFTGVLELPDGRSVDVGGGTTGKVFFTLACRIGG